MGIKTKWQEKVNQTCTQKEEDKLACHSPVTPPKALCTTIFRRERKGLILEIWYKYGNKSPSDHAVENWKSL